MSGSHEQPQHAFSYANAAVAAPGRAWRDVAPIARCFAFGFSFHIVAITWAFFAEAWKPIAAGAPDLAAKALAVGGLVAAFLAAWASVFAVSSRVLMGMLTSTIYRRRG